MSRRASSMLLFLSIVAVVGFMFWLDRAADTLPTNVEPVLDEEEVVAELSLGQLASDPAGVVGSTGVIRSVEVAERLGRGAFAIRLDSATVFPVLLSPDLIQMGTEVFGQDLVTLHGHVFTFNDSIRAVWLDQEAVDAENAEAIPATPSFMLADSLAFN